MTFLLRVAMGSSNKNYTLINITLTLLLCLLLLYLTCLQNLTSFRGRLFKPIGTLHQPRSRSHKMSLHDYLFILGIQRRLPASGSWSLLRHSMTPGSPTGIRQAIPGNRPTQAKSLSLGEYVFPTDITFMFTHTLIARCRCSYSFIVLSMLV